MWKDPIVEDIHATRKRIAAECHYDFKQLVTRLRKLEEIHQERLVSPSKGKAESQAQE
jgi:hypothetical protein